MQAQIIRDFGGPEVFELADLPRPRPGRGEVLVEVHATSVNPIDYKIRGGGRAAICNDLPATLHGDVAGRVVEVGLGVVQLRPGDEVYGCAGGVRGTAGGALAELMIADQRLLAKKPRRLSMREAAALPLVSITAWEALYDRAGVSAGQRTLIYGGTGGVGHIAVQLAKARGARVVSTASSPAKAEIAERLGANVVIDHRAPDAAEQLRKASGGEGFDLVFDTVGGAHLDEAFTAARINGTVISVSTLEPHDLSTMHRNGLSLHVVFMLIPLLHGINRERHGWIMKDLAHMVDAGELTPLLDERRFSLAEAAEAHRHLESGAATGKVVIDVA